MTKISDGFPFFSIAKAHGVDYGLVAQYADSQLHPDRAAPPAGVPEEVRIDVAVHKVRRFGPIIETSLSL